MRIVEFVSEADQEFEESIAWYEERQPGLGLEFRDEVFALLKRAAAAPEQFRKVHKEVRQAVLLRFPFVLRFALQADRLLVLAVYHASRDPDDLSTR
jgi:plasmid stabilization system protein ParE